jgi:release factor glutamine methyltransferase
LGAAASKDPKKDRWTVLEVLRWTTGRFEERALDTPRLDAEVMIAAALGLPRVQLYVQFDRPLDATELGVIREHVRRRQAGESVAYIVGRKEFFGLDFAVDHRVLVPRPDTETLVDEALARLRARPSDAAPPRIADVGTGSGAIIVALGKHLPGALLFAIDISSDALEVARANAAHHAVAVTFLDGDLTAPLGPHGPFDLIVANLPYVRTSDLVGLPPEVRAEPIGALDGGTDGLDLVRRLVVQAPPLLAPGGALVLEIGAGQADQTVTLCQAAGFVDARSRRDLGAVDRVVSVVKP